VSVACDGPGVAAAIRLAAAAVADQRAELTRLDREIGDGDHGENLHRGFQAVLAKLDAEPGLAPGGVLKLVATTLISTVGGAAGPLYGTAFLRAATAVGAAEVLDAGAVQAALAAARDGVQARGHAEPGDKTMVDAMAPAAEALTAAVASGASLAAGLAATAAAARSGAHATEPMLARRGRASYVGDAARGVMDPGALTVALLFESALPG
jgi:phosphoenolpyruvate---glycerone phosphotransferase subunit DhaL